VSELIVTGPFVRIAQDRVGFRGFLEFFLGLFIARIPVGMILQRKFAISFLEFLRACTSTHA